jgi:hypothetical protein
MTITVIFIVDHKAHLPEINIKVTGNNLQELKNQAEKFAQDLALLKGYPPNEMSVRIVGGGKGNHVVTLDPLSKTER